MYHLCSQFSPVCRAGSHPALRATGTRMQHRPPRHRKARLHGRPAGRPYDLPEIDRFPFGSAFPRGCRAGSHPAGGPPASRGVPINRARSPMDVGAACTPPGEPPGDPERSRQDHPLTAGSHPALRATGTRMQHRPPRHRKARLHGRPAGRPYDLPEIDRFPFGSAFPRGCRAGSHPAGEPPASRGVPFSFPPPPPGICRSGSCTPHTSPSVRTVPCNS